MPKTKTGRAASGRPNFRSREPHTALGLVFEANALAERGDRTRARELYRQAIAINPRLAAAWLGLGLDSNETGDFAEGSRCLMRAVAEADAALRKFPSDVLSHVARSAAESYLFRPAEAVGSARHALRLAPEATLHGQMLFLMNFVAGNTPEAQFAEALRWNDLYAAPLARQARPHANRPDPGRRLRIGYVSPDLHAHPIMRFLPPILEFHDRSQFAATVYSVGRKTDQSTAEIRGLVDHFLPWTESGAALAERVREDEIDILVDLAGHTMSPEYFLVFARKPAPVQASWLGVLSTTGLQTMDYYVGNADLPCPGTEPCFSETVYRLPRAPYCYRAPMDAPIAPSPVLDRGYITFGSFNNPAKIGRGVVKLWSEVLRNVPGSRLLLKFKAMDTDALRGRFQSWFSQDGIASERLRFAGPSPVDEYLASYGEIDIALDPFPYQGGSTTLDTLWMGVPMVAMSGRLAVQRSSTCILKSVGLPDSVVDSPEQYVKAAVFLAGIVGRIPQLRANVRKAFQASPFMDERGFTRELEAAYRDMWRTWCAKQRMVSQAPALE